jgi:hypothetical protein
LNGLLSDTSGECKTDVNPPGMTSGSLFISIRIFFVLSPKCIQVSHLLGQGIFHFLAFEMLSWICW